MNYHLSGHLQVRNTLPHILEDTLDDGSGNRVTVLGFNRKGRYLAAGHHDGRCTIWDFDTRTIAKVFIGHVRPLTSVSWSRSSQYLVTSSLDWNIRVWDITTSTFYYSHTFNSMVFKAQFHPVESLLLVSLWMDSPHLINIETGEIIILKEEKWDEDDDTTNQFSASFNTTGDLIYVVGSDGSINIIRTTTKKVVNSFVAVEELHSQNKIGIKSITFSRDGRQYLLNSMDKAMRLYNVEDNSFSLKLVQQVDMLQWKVCQFYGEDFVISCSSETAMQKIYIWDRNFGSLITILEGPKDIILDLTHHPTRPLYCAASATGLVFIWGQQHTESWSAYAPGFTELEENEEYIEREDEFDEIPDTPKVVKENVEELSIEIDMASVEEEDDYYFPVQPIHDGDMVSATQPCPSPTKSKRRQKFLK